MEKDGMTLARTLALLLGTLATMLCVVTLRVETTRVHSRLADLDRTEQDLREQVRAEELELARWRSPTLIREKLREFRRATLGLSQPASAPTEPAKPSDKRRRQRR